MAADDMTNDDGEEFTEEDLGLTDDEIGTLIETAEAGADDLLDLSDAVLPLPAGTYTYELAKVDTAASKAGERMLVVLGRVADPGPYFGRSVQRKYMLQGKGAGFAVPFFEALGFVMDEQTGRMPVTMAALRSLVGSKFKAVTSRDGGFNEWDEFLPLD